MTTYLGMPTAPRGVGQLRGNEPFPAAARTALGDGQLRANLGRATTTIRGKRAAVVAELPDWAELREAGAAIKDAVLADLGPLLERLEAAVTARGGVVHWARDAAEANRIVTELVRATGETEVVKVKSMATQEIGLNEALGAAGISAWETDLAELIVQLADDKPSHILVPAIHRNRTEIRDIFRAAGLSGVDTDEPRVLAEAARRHLRAKFLAARVAISGANFAVAETGTLCVVESEGNGRMCLTLPRTLITVMGIEKLVPTWRDLEVFLQLLPRSSTGERMNPYTSLWTGITPGDGPQEFHLVLLDNGRTATLADPDGRAALRCIRCSACLNVCPVYERTGGHAYGSVYPGPIGAVLSPQLTGIADNPSLPFASTLCGACYDVCPVAIDITTMLVHLRARVATETSGHAVERAALGAVGAVMRRPAAWRWALRAVRLGRLLPRHRRLPGPGLAAWTTARDLPDLPRRSFRDWYAAAHSASEDDPAPPMTSKIISAVRRNVRPNGAERRTPRSDANKITDVRTGRAAVLARIAAAGATGQIAVPRDYRGVGGVVAERAALIELLVDRLVDYRATVHRCSYADVPGTVATALAAAGARRVVVPAGFPEAWWPTPSGPDAPTATPPTPDRSSSGRKTAVAPAAPALTLVADEPQLTAAELDDLDGALTTARVAVAETGTIVLDGGAGMSRRAVTLVPDLHLIVLSTDQVVAGVPDATAALDPSARRRGSAAPAPPATSSCSASRACTAPAP